MAARAVDRSLVVRNWLFGWYILEYEEGGADRQELYGKALIDRLGGRLRADDIKGCRASNLRERRAFYEVFSEIRPAVSLESGEPSEIQQTLSVAYLPPDSLPPVHVLTTPRP